MKKKEVVVEKKPDKELTCMMCAAIWTLETKTCPNCGSNKINITWKN